MAVQETLYKDAKTNTYLLHHKVSVPGRPSYEQLRIYDGNDHVAREVIVRSRGKTFRSTNNPVVTDLPQELSHLLD